MVLPATVAGFTRLTTKRTGNPQALRRHELEELVGGRDVQRRGLQGDDEQVRGAQGGRDDLGQTRGQVDHDHIVTVTDERDGIGQLVAQICGIVGRNVELWLVAEPQRGRLLGIAVEEHDPAPGLCPGAGQADGHGGLAHAALLVAEDDDAGGHGALPACASTCRIASSAVS
jgi:hypothetical protein